MPKLVLSASRRTDIPAFFLPWFMSGIHSGSFDVVNPYTHAVHQVPASADQVHTIVFWSKNFGPFLDGNYGEQLVAMGYNLFFNFTINSPHKVLEPRMPSLEKRLDQLEQLARRFGAEAIQWRFDPVCIFRSAAGRRADNLDQFDRIAKHASNVGITDCITSLVDHYRKVQRRFSKHSDLLLLDPPMPEKIALVRRMVDTLTDVRIQLHLCCEKELMMNLSPKMPVNAAACIPNQRLIDLYGPGISVSKDKGQRSAAGCGCGVSKDIGSYSLHPCRHNCLYCYANPAVDRERKRCISEI
jgi:hypothetical protein